MENRRSPCPFSFRPVLRSPESELIFYQAGVGVRVSEILSTPQQRTVEFVICHQLEWELESKQTFPAGAGVAEIWLTLQQFVRLLPSHGKGSKLVSVDGKGSLVPHGMQVQLGRKDLNSAEWLESARFLFSNKL